MKHFKEFILGALCATIGVVAVQEVGEIITMASEYVKSTIGIKVVRNQKLMAEDTEENDGNFQVGFAPPLEYNEEEQVKDENDR